VNVDSSKCHGDQKKQRWPERAAIEGKYLQFLAVKSEEQKKFGVSK
jgi:hypothetical protein